MKIYNLILLNFYFLQLFPLLFGMHPGAGPQQTPFKRLNGQIRPLLEKVGNSNPCPDIAVRGLSNLFYLIL